jgi:hypothetical protein
MPLEDTVTESVAGQVNVLDKFIKVQPLCLCVCVCVCVCIKKYIHVLFCIGIGCWEVCATSSGGTSDG